MSYWENRHKKYGSSFKAVGHIGLSEEQNAKDYAAKEVALQAELEWVIAKTPPAPSVWDAGAGSGYFIPLYERLGLSPICVSDLSVAAMEQVRQKHPAVTTQVNPIKLAAWDRKFHVVVCLDVLYHVLDDSEWLESLGVLRRHLQPNGYLVIQEHFETAAHRPNVHIRFRTEKDYNQALGGQWVSRTRYRLPESNVVLDLMVYQL